MLKNYITLACRNILRHRGFSFITILGFAIGLAASYYASTFVYEMMGIDAHHQLGDRLYMAVYDKFQNGENTWKTVLGFASMKHDMEAEFPQIEKVARINTGGSKLAYKDYVFDESTYFVDTSLFSMIDIEIVKGRADRLLHDPHSVIISTKLAKKFFGSDDPIGKTIIRNRKEEFIVTAVYKSIERSYFTPAAALFPYQHFGADMQYDWGGYKVHTLVLLRPDAKLSQLNEQLTPFLRKHRPQPQAGMKEELHLEKFSDIPYNEKIMQKPYGTSKSIIVVFVVLVILILCVSCINYINLTTARATERAREVGVRKAVGASKLHLLGQFMTEAAISNILAGFVALLLIVFGLPNLQYWIYSEIPQYALLFVGNYDFLYEATFWKLFGVVFVLGSFICAIYPALVLSSFRPVDVLKGGKAMALRQKVSLSNVLVVFQFTAAAVLLIFTFGSFINNNFMQSQKTDWQLKNRIMLYEYEGSSSDTAFYTKFSRIKQELCRDPRIKTVSFSNCVPGNWLAGDFFNRLRLPKNAQPDPKSYARIWSGYDFLNMYELPLLAGRNFSESSPSDATESVVISDLAAIQMGFADPTKAVGEPVYMDNNLYKIIGVVKNFRTSNMLKPEPTLFFIYNSHTLPKGDWCQLAFHVAYENDTDKNIKTLIQQKLKGLYPKNIAEVQSVEEVFNMNFIYSKMNIKFFTVYALIAILISCMGLYGLSLLVISRRTKEIGIRKVLGASEIQLIKLLSAGFLSWVLLAVLIGALLGYACMIGYLTMLETQQQLHAMIAWWWIALPSVFILLLAAITISVQTWRISRANPVQSLRYE